MFRTVNDFLKIWKYESDATLKVLQTVTDESLAQQVSPEGRSLGRLAWHVAVSPIEMLRHAGLQAEGPGDNDPVPSHASEIVTAYEKGAADVAAIVPAAWPDAQLAEEISIYGEQWAKGFVLFVLIAHQTHHRGQMTVLLRQAGLRVPGVYGPAKEDWAAYGMAAPA